MTAAKMNPLTAVFSRSTSDVEETTRTILQQIMRNAEIFDYHVKGDGIRLIKSSSADPLSKNMTVEIMFRPMSEESTAIVETKTDYGHVVLGSVNVKNPADNNACAPAIFTSSSLPTSLLQVTGVLFDEPKGIYKITFLVNSFDDLRADLLSTSSAFARLVQFSVARRLANAAPSPRLSFNDYQHLSPSIVEFAKRRKII